MSKFKELLVKVKNIAISIGIFVLSYFVLFILADSMGFVKEPIGQAEFTQTTDELNKIKLEDQDFTIDDVKVEYESDLKKLEDEKTSKTKEIESLKNDIESLKKKL